MSFRANIIATVSLYLPPCIEGSCYHSLGGIFFYIVYNIATVNPLSYYILGSISSGFSVTIP